MVWLSLKILNSPRAGVFISVPKKIVPLAVSRNRLRRLIREAVRADAYFEGEKSFTFKVLSSAPGLKLGDVKRVIEDLKEESIH